MPIADYGVRMTGKQIKLFLVDGTPGGLTTAEITNWTGHVLSASRSDIADLLSREEAQHTGAYLLLGDDEDAIGNTRCYIGEADVVADRLRDHPLKVKPACEHRTPFQHCLFSVIEKVVGPRHRVAQGVVTLQAAP